MIAPGDLRALEAALVAALRQLGHINMVRCERCLAWTAVASPQRQQELEDAGRALRAYREAADELTRRAARVSKPKALRGGRP